MATEPRPTERPSVSRDSGAKTPSRDPRGDGGKPGVDASGSKPGTRAPRKPEPPLPPLTADPAGGDRGGSGGSPELSSDAVMPGAATGKANDLLGREVFGVPVQGTTGGPLVRGEPTGGGDNNGTIVIDNSINGSTIYNDNRTYYNYIDGIGYCNGWWPGSSWSSCGPCPWWQPYECSNGLSVSIGFGGDGFSFGFFYGSSCAPLCSSWCNPWWDGYATYWTCSPRPWWGSPCAPWWWSSRACWNPCGPWWLSYVRCGPCPLPAYTPCYTYSPFVCSTTVYTTPVVYQAAVAAPVAPAPPLPNPSDLWSYLADGYDDAAERGFVQLAAVDPGESSWLVGKAFAQAFRGDTAWSSDTLRSAFLRDPSGIVRASTDPRFFGRLEALERSLSPLAGGRTPWVDALLVTAASQATRGDLAAAYFTATTAQAEGDRSAGTAAFVEWLRLELRGRI